MKYHDAFGFERSIQVSVSKFSLNCRLHDILHILEQVLQCGHALLRWKIMKIYILKIFHLELLNTGCFWLCRSGH